MLSRVVNAFFGCWHQHYSFPITIKKGKRSRAAFPTGMYVVCLDCGKELPYDWQQMKVVSGRTKPSPVGSLATKEAA